MIVPIETIAPLVGSVMLLLAHARFIVNYVTLWFQLQITKLVDNLQLKYAHLRILQVSLIIIRHYVKLNYIGPTVHCVTTMVSFKNCKISQI